MAATCGIDWASDWHDVHIADEHGRLLGRATFTHDEAGRERVDRAAARPPRRVLVAIERPDGLLVGRLLAAGVGARDPPQPGQGSPRPLPRRGGQERPLRRVRAVRARENRPSPLRRARAVRRRDTRAADARAYPGGARRRACHLANQLRAQLEAFWPGAERIFADVDSPIALAFLQRYPSPSRRRRPGRETPRKASSPATPTADARPAPSCSPGCAAHPTPSSASSKPKPDATAVLGLVAALRPIVEQIGQLTSQIAGAIRAHPDGPIFLALLQRPQERHHRRRPARRNRRQPRPLPHQRRARRRRRPSPRRRSNPANAATRLPLGLRQTPARPLRHLADSTRHWHPWAHDIYQRARARGCDHPHAIRILGRAWTRMLWRCWQDHTPYDPTQHRALNQLLAQKG